MLRKTSVFLVFVLPGLIFISFLKVFVVWLNWLGWLGWLAELANKAGRAGWLQPFSGPLLLKPFLFNQNYYFGLGAPWPPWTPPELLDVLVSLDLLESKTRTPRELTVHGCKS